MVEFRSLKSDELERWFEHCSSVFQTTPIQYFKNHWFNDPWRDINSIFVAVENNKILSTVRVFNREIHACGEKIKMGGIGEVSTIPEARKKGLSIQLLNMAIDYMKSHGIYVSLLFGNHLNYSKLGWKAIGLCQNMSLAGCYKGLYKIRKINFDNDVTQVKNIYEKYNSQLNGSLVRDDEYYWKSWIKTEETNCYVAENDNKDIVGYICFNIKDNIVIVRDFSAKLNCKNVFEELTSYVCNKFSISNEIMYPAPINNALKIKAFDKTDGIMVRLISPFEIADTIINDTDKLIEVLSAGENYNHSFKYVFWNVDGF